MKTRALRLYGEDNLRMEEFELPEITDDEILVKVVSDSICMSTYKLLKQGKKHKRCPKNIDTNPIIIGHEFAGDIVGVGKNWRHEFQVGEKFAQQPALNYKGSLNSPGYSYEYFGGDATYCVIPREAMEVGCLLHYSGDAYFDAALGEPVSCIIGGYHAMYHTNKRNYQHKMGIKKGGNVLILGGACPMGLGAIEYPLIVEDRPARVIVTGADDKRLANAAKLVTPERAKRNGVELRYLNPFTMNNQYAELLAVTDGKGYDDVFVYAPIRELAELADKLLAFDGCMNFFAGMQSPEFSALINLYNCRYSSTHILGSTGGNTDDLKEAISLASAQKITPALMVSHICGLNAVANAVAHLPELKAGKILCYTHLDLPLTALADLDELAKTDSRFALLAESCAAHNGLWNTESERILLSTVLPQ